MPIYEYRCLKCGHQFEKIQKISDNPASRCEKCGNRVTRVFHPVAIRFKGSGFYTTDYGKGSSRKKGKDQKKQKKSGDGSGKGSGGKKKPEAASAKKK